MLVNLSKAVLERMTAAGNERGPILYMKIESTKSLARINSSTTSFKAGQFLKGKKIS